MNTRVDDFAGRLSTQLHAALDGIQVDELPWADGHSDAIARLRRRRRVTWVRSTVSVLAAAAAITTLIVVTQPGSRSVTQSVTPSQPQVLQVVAAVAVGGSTPAELAAGDGWVFAGLWDTGQLLRLDPSTLRTTATLQVGSASNGPLSVAFGAGAVWVLNFADGRLWRVDPSSMTATSKVELPGQPSQVAVGDGSVWVTVCCMSSESATRQRLLRIDPATGAITGSRDIAGDGETVPLAVGPQVVVSSQNGPIVVINPTTMDVVRTLPSCTDCEQTASLVVGGKGIYATSSGSAVRYDARTGRVLATSPDTPAMGTTLSAQPDGIWFAGTGSVVKLDPVSLAATAELPVAGAAYLVQLANSIYISTQGTIDEVGTAEVASPPADPTCGWSAKGTPAPGYEGLSVGAAEQRAAKEGHSFQVVGQDGSCTAAAQNPLLILKFNRVSVYTRNGVVEWAQMF